MTREEFIDIVYSELHSDDDNCRANRIIDAADEYAEKQAVHYMAIEAIQNENREDYELATEQIEHDAMYEPTYNSEDGSM